MAAFSAACSFDDPARSPTVTSSGASSAAAPSASGSPSPSPASPASASPSPSPAPLAVLPRGGRSLFPEHLVVMHYGTAQTGALGVLGEVPPDQAAARLAEAAAPFEAASGRPVLPAFELITTIAQADAGADGTYSSFVSDEDVQRYLDAARRAKMLLVLDFQPGLANVLAQVQRYEKFLVQPDVGVALDPEWALRPGQRPGRQIGQMDAATVNGVSQYLSDLTVIHALPEKLLIVHQFQTRMLPDRAAILARPGLSLVFHMDGFGSQEVKKQTYAVLSTKDGLAPGGTAHNGFKLFLDEDPDLMTPAEAMALVPRPELISYQ